jgi:hypothetical protein
MIPNFANSLISLILLILLFLNNRPYFANLAIFGNFANFFIWLIFAFIFDFS